MVFIVRQYFSGQLWLLRPMVQRAATALSLKYHSKAMFTK